MPAAPRPPPAGSPTNPLPATRRCTMCRASVAPPPEHVTVTGTARGLIPTILAQQTPQDQPSLPPEHTSKTVRTQGIIFKVQDDPRGVKQRPLSSTTGPSTIESGRGATCGGRRRPGELEHWREKAGGGGWGTRQPRHLPARGAKRQRGAPPTHTSWNRATRGSGPSTKSVRALWTAEDPSQRSYVKKPYHKKAL